MDIHLSPFFKDKPLEKITTFDVERYKKARQGEKAGNGTINRELAALSHLSAVLRLPSELFFTCLPCHINSIAPEFFADAH